MKNVLMDHMNEKFERLSPLLRKAHTGHKQLKGHAVVTRGNVLANLICKIFKFPPASDNVLLTVECKHTESQMLWRRNFGGLRMESSFSKQGKYLVEHLGPLDLSFIAEEKHKQLHYDFVKTTIWGIPLPKILSPQVIAYEKDVDGVYCFNVEVSMFLVGKVIAYNGELEVSEF